jgi:hypothetical protein
MDHTFVPPEAEEITGTKQRFAPARTPLRQPGNGMGTDTGPTPEIRYAWRQRALVTVRTGILA